MDLAKLLVLDEDRASGSSSEVSPETLQEPEGDPSSDELSPKMRAAAMVRKQLQFDGSDASRPDSAIADDHLEADSSRVSGRVSGRSADDAKEAEEESALALSDDGEAPLPPPSPARQPYHFEDASTSVFGTLQVALCEGDLRVVKRAVEKNLDLVEASDARGNTMLHTCAYHGHKTVMKFLLACGCEPNGRNSDGQTALHLAAMRGHHELVHVFAFEFGAPSLLIRVRHLDPNHLSP
jgi:hypothetical protein